MLKIDEYLKKGFMAISSGGIKVLVNIGQLLFRNVFLQGINLLVVSLVTSVLTREQYGQYVFTLGILNSLTFLSLTSLNQVVIQETAKGRHGALNRALAWRLKASCLYSAVLLAIAGYYWLLGKQPGLALCISATLPFPVAMALDSYLSYVLGRSRYDFYASLPVLMGIAMAIVTALTVWLARAPATLLLAVAGAQACLNFAAYRFSLKHLPPKNDLCDPSALRFGLGLSALSIFGSISSQLNTLVVGTFTALPQVAVLSMATLAGDKTKSLLSVLEDYLTPHVVSRTGGDLFRRANWSMLIYVSVLTILVVLVSAFLPLLFRVFFPSYINIVPLAIVGLFSILITAPTRIIQMTFNTEQRLRQMSIMRIVQFPFESVVLIVMVHQLGVVGAIAASYISGASWTLMYTVIYIRNWRQAAHMLR